MKILLTILITSFIIFLTVLILNYSTYNGKNKIKINNEKERKN
jgi:hypothetical protein